MASMKSAMMGKVQTPDGELRHTDYYFFNGIDIPPGRKTSNEDEANVIYNHFKGKNVPLETVKEWILYQSPFPYHSRALAVLEKTNLLRVLDAPESRRKGTFAAYDMRLSPLNITNNWQLCFDISPDGRKCSLFDESKDFKISGIIPEEKSSKHYLEMTPKTKFDKSVHMQRPLTKMSYPYKTDSNQIRKKLFKID